jgi:hypothetical protein
MTERSEFRNGRKCAYFTLDQDVPFMTAAALRDKDKTRQIMVEICDRKKIT